MIGLGLKLQVNPAINNVIDNLLKNLEARATYYENVTCTKATLTEFENIK